MNVRKKNYIALCFAGVCKPKARPVPCSGQSGSMYKHCDGFISVYRADAGLVHSLIRAL